MTTLLDLCRLDARAWRQWADIQLDPTIDHAQPVRGQLLGEGRRRRAVCGAVREPVPRTGDAAVDDSTFAEWAALVGADVRDGGETAGVAEDRDALAAVGNRDGDAMVHRDAIDIAGVDPIAF